ncbi:hypothetical protein CPTSV76_127 [Enterobacteria phage SV76]|nr:hypothetical protein CPTSV76_127 [Enterobacteria phage SV76]
MLQSLRHIFLIMLYNCWWYNGSKSLPFNSI